ncbi:MAG TPA: EboA domain-containing protein [Candidatus Binatia bacterium]|jgi:hypothetical protein
MLEVLRGLLRARTAVPLPGDDRPDASAPDAGALLAALAGAGRRVGKATLALDESETRRLQGAGAHWPIATRLDELWRIAVLVAAAARLDGERLVADAYRGGDSDERCAVLRALPLLPAPERFTALAADACRSHVRPIFEALACENPFPARHLSTLHFNQMILKALFLDVPLMRVLGLDARRSDELGRMARDYAAERRAAGRPVSADLAALAGEGA